MNNGQRRNKEEKKEFRQNAINFGDNPYNLLNPCGRKSYGRTVIRKQFLKCKKTGKNKVIKHF